MSPKPIKRHPSLQNLSREHHDILVFALRIQKGISKNAKNIAMQTYADWFWDSYLLKHFELEEQFLFPILGNEHEFVKKAKSQHQELKTLFEIPSKKHSDFKKLYNVLQNHIRFEERKLFNLMQEVVDEEFLLEFENQHPKQQNCSLWDNPFWK